MAAVLLAALLQDHRELLDRKVEFSVTDATLEEFAEAAGTAAGTTIGVDPNVTAGKPMTFSARDQSLRDALREALYPRGLTVTWRDGLVIVARARTKPPLETKTYDAADAIRRLREHGAPEVEGALERDVVRLLGRLAERPADDPIFSLRPEVAKSGRVIRIETPHIELFRTGQTVIVPSGGSVALAGLLRSQSGGLNGSTTASVNVEIIELDPDYEYGYAYDDGSPGEAAEEGLTATLTGESMAVVGETLVARQTPDGHRRIEALMGLIADRTTAPSDN